MKKRILILLTVLLLLTASVGLAEQPTGYQEDFFINYVRQVSEGSGLIDHEIKTDMAHFTLGSLEITVTKMIGDEKSAANEVVITLNDDAAELRHWETWHPSSQLQAAEDHAIYYVGVGYDEPGSFGDGFTEYTFDGGLCIVLYSSASMPTNGTIYKTLLVQACVVTPQDREETQERVSVQYEISETTGYREDYFLQRLEEKYPLDALIPRTIKSDLAHLSMDQLDIAVTKMSADCKDTITEVVVTLNDETTELKAWWEPWNHPADSLPASDDHTIYYVSVGEDVTEAYDDYSFDHGLCYIMYAHRDFQTEGTIHLAVPLLVCIVTPQGREEMQETINLEYELPPLFRQYQYDVSQEPLVDEITITSLEIDQTYLQVVDNFSYERSSDEYIASLYYGKPRISPPDACYVYIYRRPETLIKVIEFEVREGRYKPTRYWIPIPFGEEASTPAAP